MRWACVALCVLCGGGSLFALTDEAVLRDLGFNFLSPGARAQGLGGSFVGIADDVTAIQANPAGLWAVGSPQFLIELSGIDRDPRVVRSATGSLAVDPDTGERDLPYFAVTTAGEWDSESQVSFVGGASSIPLGAASRRLSVGMSRQVLVDERLSMSSGQDVSEARFAFESFPNTVNDGVVEAYSVKTPVQGGRSTEIVYWNLAASIELTRDFSLGATATYATLDLSMDTSTLVVDPAELFLDPGHPRLPPQGGADVYRNLIDDSDTSVAFSVGIHWHPATGFGGGPSPWSFGAVYRRGARFEVEETTTLNGIEDERFANDVIVPDRWAMGGAYRASERWLLTAEIERIEYSDLLEGFRSGVGFLTSGRVADGAFEVDPQASIEYDVDDALVPRLGVEYAREPAGERGLPFALWAGFYRMPDGSIEMTRFNSTDPAVNQAYLGAFGAGDDEDHWTLGGQLSFGRSSIQLAGDVWDGGARVAASYRLNLGRNVPSMGPAPDARRQGLEGRASDE